MDLLIDDYDKHNQQKLISSSQNKLNSRLCYIINVLRDKNIIKLWSQN